jgi:hypothetical protein
MAHSPWRRDRLAPALVTLAVVLAGAGCGVGDVAGDPVVTPPERSSTPLAPVDPPVEVIGLPDDVELEVSDGVPGVENGENLSFVSPVYTLNPPGPLGSSVTVRLRLDNALPATSPVLVATRTSAERPWTYAPGTLTSDARHVDFETSSLDEVGALAVDVEGALAGFQQDLAAGLATRVDRTARKPVCAGEKAAREQGYTVAASKTRTLFWCFGLESGKRVIKITNRRPIPVELAHPNVPVLADPEAEKTWASWSRVLGTENTVLAPGRTVTYDADLEPSTELMLDAESLAVGQSLRLVQAVVRAVALRLGKFGTAPLNLTTTVDSFLAMPQCARSLGKGSDAVLAGCFTQAKLARLFGTRARLLLPLVSASELPLVLRQQTESLALWSRTTDRQRILVRRTAPDFKAFTALWAGPRRLLSIDSDGRVTEMVTDEAGAEIIRLSYQLEEPEGTAATASASATITAVTLSKRKLVNGRVPRVGDTGTVNVRKGVLTPPFLRTTYCTPAATKRGACGS